MAGRSGRDRPAKLYFAYGSNLSLNQMAKRCPDSEFVGLGYLPGFRWHINERRYANVLPSSRGSVPGLVFRINKRDEQALDRCEGVALQYYQKRMLPIQLERNPNYSGQPTLDVAYDVAQDFSRAARMNRNHVPCEDTVALVYISELYVNDGIIKDEYINRIREGVHFATALGFPQEFVDRVITPRLGGYSSRPHSSAGTARHETYRPPTSTAGTAYRPPTPTAGTACRPPTPTAGIARHEIYRPPTPPLRRSPSLHEVQVTVNRPGMYNTSEAGSPATPQSSSPPAADGREKREATGTATATSMSTVASTDIVVGDDDGMAFKCRVPGCRHGGGGKICLLRRENRLPHATTGARFHADVLTLLEQQMSSGTKSCTRNRASRTDLNVEKSFLTFLTDMPHEMAYMNTSGVTWADANPYRTRTRDLFSTDHRPLSGHDPRPGSGAELKRDSMKGSLKSSMNDLIHDSKSDSRSVDGSRCVYSVVTQVPLVEDEAVYAVECTTTTLASANELAMRNFRNLCDEYFRRTTSDTFAGPGAPSDGAKTSNNGANQGGVVIGPPIKKTNVVDFVEEPGKIVCIVGDTGCLQFSAVRPDGCGRIRVWVSMHELLDWE